MYTTHLYISLLSASNCAVSSLPPPPPPERYEESIWSEGEPADLEAAAAAAAAAATEVEVTGDDLSASLPESPSMSGGWVFIVRGKEVSVVAEAVDEAVEAAMTEE